MAEKTSREFPLYVTRKADVSKKRLVLTKVISILSALLLAGIIGAIFNATSNDEGMGFFESFGMFYSEMVSAVFSTPSLFIRVLQKTAILLIIALALTPAFKMKFWNIGGEGQVLISALVCALIMNYVGSNVPAFVLVVLMLAGSILAGAIWAFIPAFFKAFFNTNETLFTLMMNYVAMGLVTFAICFWAKDGSGTIGIINPGTHAGWFPTIGGYDYILNIILGAVVLIAVYFYLSFTKHGFEISVIGGSVNTARYLGINVKKVVIRTLILSGALCGFAGFIIVAGTDHTIFKDIVGGRGFTAILVSWLAHFNPFEMVLSSFLVSFIDQGASSVSNSFGFGDGFADILIGVFFFLIIASEFFNNYTIHVRHRIKSGEDAIPAGGEKEA